jgi:hypothetical protein
VETYLALAHEADPMGEGAPDSVEKEFRSYLKCGILAHGFARARCSGCGYEFLVAYPCNGRGACPSCSVKRMAETAAHLVDHVIPHVPVRQWVLSVPKRLRPFLHHRPRTAAMGAVSFLHRFGSSLNPHYHFHSCLMGLQEAVAAKVLLNPFSDGGLEALQELAGEGCGVVEAEAGCWIGRILSRTATRCWRS